MSKHSHNQNCSLAPAAFVKGITGEDEILTEDVPHVVFSGRSNAGKSSTINRLLGGGIARTSSTPGKTQEINFFSVSGGRGYVVDLPGFGFAKIPARRAEKLRRQMIWYLAESAAPIALVVLVVDIRRGLGDKEGDLLDIAAGESLPVIVLANKIDKCNQKETHAAKEKLAADVEKRGAEVEGVLPFSATKGTGRQTLCEIMQDIYAV